ncbi:uncharacterized protein LOC110704263 [Chenopodium quinoa]|uniref:uncharacterized protein LOC110704263 n=1 Tax=Chenopodium quinoa TaxID=63459 RepID=UPI000B76F3D9|nr:uncharacterized protein LOC110704263 [Chenopodium quinoa]
MWECDCPSSCKKAKLAELQSTQGMDALSVAHPIFSNPDLLVVHVFSKLDWGSRDNVKKVCRKWRLWWKTRHLARLQPFFGPRASVDEWILNDLIYNDGRDFHAWINNDMTVYFDGFPLLFKEDV